MPSTQRGNASSIHYQRTFRRHVKPRLALRSQGYEAHSRSPYDHGRGIRRTGTKPPCRWACIITYSAGNVSGGKRLESQRGGASMARGKGEEGEIGLPAENQNPPSARRYFRRNYAARVPLRIIKVRSRRRNEGRD